MSIKMKESDVTLKIPRLFSKKHFRTWEEAIKRYFGTLKLKHYINYDVQEPLLSLEIPEVTQFDNQLKVSMKVKNKVVLTNDFIQKLPVELRR